MSSHNNSSSANDPRQPSSAKPFVPPAVSPQDLPVDYSGFIAVVFGIAGVMFRYKLCSWLAIICCAQSLANMKNVETDLKQISMAMMFGIMGLVTNYLGTARPGTKTQGHVAPFMKLSHLLSACGATVTVVITESKHARIVDQPQPGFNSSMPKTGDDQQS
ncbi:hypothetical protein QYF36_005125 [Acer negundo]|nr:hypothetical protein QYF36_005125 [Acer negundo]